MKKTIQEILQDKIKEYNIYQKQSKKVRIQAEEIRQQSKKSIFLLLKNKKKEAAVILKKVEKMIIDAEKVIKKEGFKREIGSYKVAIEEYLEAKFTYSYLEGKKTIALPIIASLSPEVFIGAVSDFTGELIRASILDATEGKTDKLKNIKDVIERIIIDHTSLDVVSGGYLRNKVEQVDKNLRKLEDILYTMTVVRGKK